MSPEINKCLLGSKTTPLRTTHCSATGVGKFFSVKVQRASILDFLGHIQSVTYFYFLKMQIVLSLRTVQKQTAGCTLLTHYWLSHVSLLCYSSHEEYNETKNCLPSCSSYRFSLVCLLMCPEGARWCSSHFNIKYQARISLPKLSCLLRAKCTVMAFPYHRHTFSPQH